MNRRQELIRLQVVRWWGALTSTVLPERSTFELPVCTTPPSKVGPWQRVNDRFEQAGLAQRNPETRNIRPEVVRRILPPLLLEPSPRACGPRNLMKNVLMAGLPESSIRQPSIGSVRIMRRCGLASTFPILPDRALRCELSYRESARRADTCDQRSLCR